MVTGVIRITSPRSHVLRLAERGGRFSITAFTGEVSNESFRQVNFPYKLDKNAFPISDYRPNARRTGSHAMRRRLWYPLARPESPENAGSFHDRND